MSKLPEITFSEILREFIRDFNYTLETLAAATDLKLDDICKLSRNQMVVTDDIAERLSKVFGNSKQFWLNTYNNCENRNSNGS